MKRVRKLSSSTPGLANYLAWVGSPLDWNRFHDDDREAYRELRYALVELQHHLCGYCEIDLIENDIQVEHIVPQSDPHLGAAHSLDHANLMAACRGGTESMFDSERFRDERRFRRRVSDNTSCGPAKRNVNDPDFIDPRDLPSLPSLLKVQPNGIIVADDAACADTGMDANQIRKTIEILGLNVERLRQERESRWNNLEAAWGSLGNDDEALNEGARKELLPPNGSILPKFFTTARSYFGKRGERILTEPPQSWI